MSDSGMLKGPPPQRNLPLLCSSSDYPSSANVYPVTMEKEVVFEFIVLAPETADP
jgi:hypothetical protein